jgi:hypothetical protein
VGALLADTGFILKPYLDRLAGSSGAGEQGVLYQADQVFPGYPLSSANLGGI